MLLFVETYKSICVAFLFAGDHQPGMCLHMERHISSDRGSGRRPSKNMEARERMVAILATTA